MPADSRDGVPPIDAASPAGGAVVRATRAHAKTNECELEFLRHSSEPLQHEEQQTFVELRDSRSLANDRVSAIVITRLADGIEGKKVVIFAQEAGVYQIDAIIESAQERERTTQTTILQPAGAITAEFKSLRRRL